MPMRDPEQAEPNPNADAGGETSKTVEIPASLAGDAKTGDIVRLRVVSADGETCTCEAADEAKTGGSQAMASEFDQPETENEQD